MGSRENRKWGDVTPSTQVHRGLNLLSLLLVLLLLVYDRFQWSLKEWDGWWRGVPPPMINMSNFNRFPPPKVGGGCPIRWPKTRHRKLCDNHQPVIYISRMWAFIVVLLVYLMYVFRWNDLNLRLCFLVNDGNEDIRLVSCWNGFLSTGVLAWFG